MSIGLTRYKTYSILSLFELDKAYKGILWYMSGHLTDIEL